MASSQTTSGSTGRGPKASQTGLALRSRVSREGELRLFLEEAETGEPGPDELIVRIEAAPINPSDLGLLLASADPRGLAPSGPRSSARPQRRRAAGAPPRARRPAGCRHAGRKRRRRSRRRRRGAGGASARPDRRGRGRRHVRAVSPGADVRLSPSPSGGVGRRRRLLLHQSADRARNDRDDAAAGTLCTGAHGGGVQPRPDAQSHLPGRRRPAGQRRAQPGPGGAPAQGRRAARGRQQRPRLPDPVDRGDRRDRRDARLRRRRRRRAGGRDPAMHGSGPPPDGRPPTAATARPSTSRSTSTEPSTPDPSPSSGTSAWRGASAGGCSSRSWRRSRRRTARG